MKFVVLSSLLFVLPVVAFAAEECPVSKISLARGLTCESLQLVGQITERDSKIDAICLKLGRVSAILRRTQGQLPGHEQTPVPPKDWKQRAIEIEGFCGVGPDATLPRGLTHGEYVTRAGNGFKHYLKARLVEQNRFIDDNQDPQEAQCPKPAELKTSELADCT